MTGSWSGLSDAGEATNLNLVHINGRDILDVNDLTYLEMESRQKVTRTCPSDMQSIMILHVFCQSISRVQVTKALDALKGVVPGFEKAKLRNIGMTIGTRDSRKIVGRHNLTGEEVKNQFRCEDSVGVRCNS